MPLASPSENANLVTNTVLDEEFIPGTNGIVLEGLSSGLVFFTKVDNGNFIGMNVGAITVHSVDSGPNDLNVWAAPGLVEAGILQISEYTLTASIAGPVGVVGECRLSVLRVVTSIGVAWPATFLGAVQVFNQPSYIQIASNGSCAAGCDAIRAAAIAAAAVVNTNCRDSVNSNTNLQLAGAAISCSLSAFSGPAAPFLYAACLSALTNIILVNEAHNLNVCEANRQSSVSLADTQHGLCMIGCRSTQPSPGPNPDADPAPTPPENPFVGPPAPPSVSPGVPGVPGYVFPILID